MNMRRFIYLALLLFTSKVLATPGGEMVGIKIKSHPSRSSFIFLLTNKTFGNISYFPSTKKILISFANLKMNFNQPQLTFKKANISNLLTKQINTQLSVIIGVNETIQYQLHFLPIDKKTKLVQLQLDVISLPKVAIILPKTDLKKAFKQDALQTFKLLHHEMKQKKFSIIKKTRTEFYQYKPEDLATKRIFTVVIDAGHGGKDPGAHGRNGTLEKTVVLSVANKLAAKINQSTGMRAILTRNSDRYVPLRTRLALARKDKADLFVAIHADAFFNKAAEGASVYALSPHGATTEAARWLARQDNYSELGGVELDALQDRSPLLRSVLIDLAQTATIRDSLFLGNKVLDALDNISSLHYKHVAQAPFVVLKSPDIPSILVEIGFITNLREEKRLANTLYQQRVAHALYEGINQYVQKYGKYS